MTGRARDVPAVAARTPAARRAPVAHTVARIGRVNLGYLVRFWLIVVPFFVVFSLWLVYVDGELDAAVILYSRHGAIWFPFAQAIAIVTGYLRVHVAAGLTRRTFARATVVVAAGTGLAYAVVLTALAALERELHHAAGWGWRVADAVLATEASPAGLLLVELALVCVAGNVSGLLVGAVYARAGGWWGTLALPLTAGPVVAVLMLLGGGGGTPPGRFSWAAAAPVVLASLAVLAAAAAAYAAVVRRTPVSSRTT